MKLSKIVIKNFRAYKEEIRISIDDFTAFIGKNDVGKSTILESLELFFNGTHSNLIKIESSDACVYSNDKRVVIGCAFSDLPDEIVIDAQKSTSLKNEYLLNSKGELEIHKEFDCSLAKPKETVYAVAMHPTAEFVGDLLELTNSELKNRARQLGVDLSDIDERSNPDLRAAIRKHVGDLKLRLVRVPLNKQDAKAVWESISRQLPKFALFQADRPSKDEDSEVQDPMKLAVNEAIKSVEDKLEEVREVVRRQALEVATRTLEKLREMDPELAKELSPNFKAEPKWEGLFKLSLTGDDQIPINKRGSGVRRLILLNFFRAEAERKQQIEGGSGIIYGIEEPETAQHPNNQKMLVEALTTLSQQDNCQVIITTHVPGLAGFLDVRSLRYIEVDSDGNRRILAGDDLVYEKIANQLGVLPDSRVKLFVCVEGPHDVRFLYHMSRILHEKYPDIPDLQSDPRVSVFHLGGSTLKDWVQHHYLKNLEKPEVHIYDRDDGVTPKYQREYDMINARNDGSIAFITRKREMENYLHPDAIQEEFGFRITFSDMDDVPELVARTLHERASDTPWESLAPEKKKKKVSRAKDRLNNGAASKMTYERLIESDPHGQVISWLNAIAARLSNR